MANRQEELVLAIEELTGTMKRQSSITETMGQAIQAAMTSSENLKAAMLKTGSFQENKMLRAIDNLSDMPGRIDKVIQGFGQFLNQGLGQHTKTFQKVISQITALGLDNGPFLQLARSMNAKMGMSLDQQTEQLKSLMNLRVVTGQNPELMAKALAAQSQTFEQAAGIWGPGFSEKLMNSMKIMAQGRGGHEMVAKMMNMLKPLLEAGPEGMAKRAALNQGKGPNLHENMSQQEMIQWIMTSMESMGTNPAFQSAITRSVTGGGLLGMGGGAEFQTAQQMRSRLKGQTAGSLMADLARTGGDMDALAGPAGQGASELLSTKLARATNQFANVLPEAITIVQKSLDGLAESATGLADKFAGWLKGKANQGAGILATGITALRGGSSDLGGMLGGLLAGEGGMLSGAMSGGSDFLKSGWKVLSNSVMLLVKAFTEGGALGALGDILKGWWDWMKAAIPHFLTGASELLGANVAFWAAEGKALVDHLLASALVWADYFIGMIKLNMDMLWADISRSSILLSDSPLTSQEIYDDEFYGASSIESRRDWKLKNAGDTRELASGRAARSLAWVEEQGILAHDSMDMNVAARDINVGIQDLKDAFTKGPQAERLQSIEDGLKDMWKISKDSWDEVVGWVKNN